MRLVVLSLLATTVLAASVFLLLGERETAPSLRGPLADEPNPAFAEPGEHTESPADTGGSSPARTAEDGGTPAWKPGDRFVRATPGMRPGETPDGASGDDPSNRDAREVRRRESSLALTRIRERLAALRHSDTGPNAPRGAAGARSGDAAATATEGTEVDAIDVEAFDLDGDAAVEAWEIERAEQLVSRAEQHAQRNDTAGWELEAADANEDGQLEAQEYYDFLVEATKRSIALDANGDGVIALEESGLAKEPFDALDRDRSGFLKPWEVRRAVASGEL